MLSSFLSDKVLYNIFDRQNKVLTHVYNEHRFPERIIEIKKNKEFVKKNFSADKIVTLYQIHGTKIYHATNNHNENQLIEADGIVTTTPKIVLSIQTADCVPVFFYSETNLNKNTSIKHIIGAAHCGWKGTKLNIIKKISEEMKKMGAQKIKAIIGPSIHQNSYEVDNIFYKSFIKESLLYNEFFKFAPKKDHYLFDLPSFVRYKLEKENIEIYKHIVEDTYSLPSKYPSYRRSFHNNEECFDRILSSIMIK